MYEQLRSILIYLSVFGISLGLFRLYERQEKKISVPRDAEEEHLLDCKKALTGKSVYAWIALLLPCLLAGLRGPTVGVDTDGYPVRFTANALMSHDFMSFLNGPAGISSEPLGALLVWLCAQLHYGTVPLLFCYQLLTIGPVFLAIRKYRQQMSITVAMAVYLFFFYNSSLNMMRQSVTCALLLLAVSDFMTTGKIRARCVFLCIAAILFHRSVPYGLVLIAVVVLVARLQSRLMVALLFCAVIVSPLAMTEISQFLISSGIADRNMQTYISIFVSRDIDVDWFVNPLGLYSLAYLLIYTALVFSPVLLKSSLFESGREVLRIGTTSRTLHIVNLAGYLIYVALLFSTSSMYGMRFSVYFDFFLIIAMPLACEGTKAAHKKLLLMMALIAFWFLWIIRLGWSGSQVYLFFFE